jgi:hypothetical protein
LVEFSPHICTSRMGNSSSTSVLEKTVQYTVIGGFVALGATSLFGSATKRSIQVPVSPLGHNDSFLSMESVEGSELEGEIERTATFIANVKWLMQNEPLGTRKRQLEESLSRAESSFNNLFELKTKLEEYETNGVILGSRVTSEIAKSAAMRDIEERLLFSGFGKGGLSGPVPEHRGDSSPYKRQRTQTS